MLRIESFSRETEGFCFVYRNDAYALGDILERLSAPETRIDRVLVRSEEPRLCGVMSFSAFLAARGDILAAAMEPRDTTVRIEGAAGGVSFSLAFDPLDVGELVFTSSDKNARLARLLDGAARPQ